MAAAGISVVVVCALVALFALGPTGQAQRWSAFPQTINCSVERLGQQPYEPGHASAPLPEVAEVQQVTLTHPGDQQVEANVSFAHGAPPDSVTLRHPALGTEVPVTLDYDLRFTDFSRSAGAPNEYVSVGTARTGSWEGDKGISVVSSEKTDNGFEVLFDVSGKVDKIGDAPWRPSVRFSINGKGPPNALFPANEKWTFDNQSCFWTGPPPNWNTSASPTQASGAPSSLQPSTPFPSGGDPGSPSQTDAIPLPTSQAVQFESMTGNIVCHMSRTGAACEIREHEYTAPPTPPNCAQYGDRFGLDIGGGGSIACHRGNFFGQPLPTQAYGIPVTAGSITCVIDQDAGVRCSDSTTGHFFQVSRQAYQIG